MCGIVGELTFRRSAPVSLSSIESMLSQIPHRGPDNTSIWLSETNAVGLGHARLSITDLDSSANQPLFSPDQSVVVVFNGEIYNHRELRAELTNAGHSFKTDHSDTEVLVVGYQHWGLDQLLNKVNGMFAFALYDRAKDVFFLARDRIGIKPVYFIESPDNSFHFASEIKALASVRGRLDVSASSIQHYLSFIATPAPQTMFKGISKLQNGHYITIRNNQVEVSKYWDLAQCNSAQQQPFSDLREAKDQILDLLSSSIDLRAVSDVQSGVLLSGGIDSSAICAIAKSRGFKFDTFTVGFSDYTHLNEVDDAADFSASLGLNHHKILVNEEDMKSYIDELVYVQDEPIADWVCIPLHFVSQLAKSKGVKVLLVGEGADEQFFGYPSYSYYMYLQKYYFRYFNHLPVVLKQSIFSLMNRLLGANSGYLSRLDILRRSINKEEAFWGGATVFWDLQKRHLFGSYDRFQSMIARELGESTERFASTSGSSQLIKDISEHFRKHNPGCDYFQIMAYIEFCIRLPELLLMRVDKITMSHSIEARVPFLDHRLVELTQTLRCDQRLHDKTHKGLLKWALEDTLPKSILNKPKRGFGAPMSEWLRGGFGDSVRNKIMNSTLIERFGFNKEFIDILFKAHKSNTTDYASHIWSLYNLTAWYDKWID